MDQKTKVWLEKQTQDDYDTLLAKVTDSHKHINFLIDDNVQEQLGITQTGETRTLPLRVVRLCGGYNQLQTQSDCDKVAYKEAAKIGKEINTKLETAKGILGRVLVADDGIVKNNGPCIYPACLMCQIVKEIRAFLEGGGR